MPKIIHKMSEVIHIGSIIRSELRRKGKTNGWLAKTIYSEEL